MFKECSCIISENLKQPRYPLRRAWICSHNRILHRDAKEQNKDMCNKTGELASFPEGFSKSAWFPLSKRMLGWSVSFDVYIRLSERRQM